MTPRDNDDISRNEPPLRTRLLWMLLLWGAGVSSVTVVAYAIRLMIMPD